MNEKYEWLSSFMTFALRHDPSDAGIELDGHGWVSISSLAEAARKQRDWVNEEDVEHVVSKGKEDGEKERFEIKNNQVRAKYGHNEKLDVTIDGDSNNIPDILFHGTPTENLESILKEGLRSMDRQKVCLSDNYQDSKEVANRYSDNITILEINAKKMLENNYTIEEKGDVYEVDYIPPEFITT